MPPKIRGHSPIFGRTSYSGPSPEVSTPLTISHIATKNSFAIIGRARTRPTIISIPIPE